MSSLSVPVGADITTAAHRARGGGARSSATHGPAGEVPVLLPTSTEAWTRSEPIVKVAVILVAAVLLAVVLSSGRLWGRDTPYPATLPDQAFWIMALAYGGMMYAALVWRVILWRRYRPMRCVADARLPSVSVIIPAFNEGSLVRQAILSAAASRYPGDRLEIIAVDDGSTDDTWLHILAAARQVRRCTRITTLRQSANQGKRRALRLGFSHGRGEVFVTMDSDSVLESDALRNAVSPLVREPAIGCVAGCVRVLNPRESLMTRFLKCTFSLSFRFVRAYQNEFRGVFCTPGAMSVYRADVVRRVADAWVNQRFLGLPCVTGEDRAMTNFFLREGWLTAYQGNAVVRCKMPHTYSGLTKMFLRWARSNIRETLFLFGFLFKRFRTRHLRSFRLNMLLAAMSLVLPVLLIVNGTLLLATGDGSLVRHVGMVLFWATTVSVIYYINERDSDWVWFFVYWFFWAACLSWIMPYAALTLRNTGWLTRQSSDRSTADDASCPIEAAQPVRGLLPAA